MSELLRQSWSNEEELEVLARAQRNNEMVKGVVRSVAKRKMPILQEDGSYKTEEVEVAIFLLENGIKAYCPAPEFSEHEFQTITGFTNTLQEFVIDQLDLENRIAVVSVRKADEIKAKLFWDELIYLEEEGKLNEPVFEGVVSGFNPETERIFVKVNGISCFMLKYDWQHGRRIGDIATKIREERGQKINVKVLRIDKERNMVQVSRKATLEDPIKKLEEYMEMESIAAVIDGVDPVHGIFVKIEEGLVGKGIKPRNIEAPDVGDHISCRIRSIDKETQNFKVVITGYPRGKKTRKDVGSFLFE